MRRSSSPLRLVSALLALLALSASPALAQEEGVTIDGDSPAAKEYALPHEQARRDAEGSGSTSSSQGSRDSGLFGEGVSRDDAAPGSSGSSGSNASESSGSKRDASSKSSDAADSTTTTTPAPGDPAGAEPSEASISSGGIGGTTALVGGGALALFAAGLGGFALHAVRHRSAG